MKNASFINRRNFLKLTGAGFATLTLAGCEEALSSKSGKVESHKPNLIFIMADDLGYGDISCFGSREIDTPNIDKLAADGKMFTQSYSGSAVCSPTRASVLTGKYPLRFDIDEHFDDLESHLPRGVVTLPKLLKNAGYATAHIGKWHLGGLNQKHVNDRKNSIPGPLQHGFDHYLCNLEDPRIRPVLMSERRLYRDGGLSLIRNDKNAPAINRHWTDIKVDEAIELINGYNQRNKPFFLNLWFDVPHTPYEPAPEPHTSKYAGPSEKGGGTYSDMVSYLGSKLPYVPRHMPRKDPVFYRSMVSHMDANIGRLIENLKKLGIYENTLIVFTSDNGPAFQGSTGMFTGGKADLHEGGIRVPMIAAWPGHIQPGQSSDELTSTIDILPTFCEAANIKLSENLKVDGVSLLPNFLEDKPVKRTGPVFWQLNLYEWFPQPGEKPKPYATEVARDGKWKLLTMKGEPVGLYDIEKDPREQNNLINKRPDIANCLGQKVRNWLKEPRRSWRDEAKSNIP